MHSKVQFWGKNNRCKVQLKNNFFVLQHRQKCENQLVCFKQLHLKRYLNVGVHFLFIIKQFKKINYLSCISILKCEKLYKVYKI